MTEHEIVVGLALAFGVGLIVGVSITISLLVWVVKIQRRPDGWDVSMWTPRLRKPKVRAPFVSDAGVRTEIEDEEATPHVLPRDTEEWR
jgi:hypothetical protein